jgi:hypothetical protein
MLVVPLAIEVVWVQHVSMHKDDGVLHCIMYVRMMRHAASCMKRGVNILMHW